MNLFPVYPLFDINIVRGKGCHVWDDKGQSYLDLYGGHAVISIGHCHPHYIERLTQQLNTLGFYSNSVINKLQEELAEKLGRVSGYPDYQLFLINSGAEANENVGGIRMATKDFMQGLRKACDANGTLLICDEIQCGYGRSGKFFAHQHLDVRPDIITCAKGIGNGFPMGAVLISPKIEATYGMLGTTFGGNHLACTLAVLDVIEREHLVENAAKVGNYLISELKKLQQTNPNIVDVRGEGLMIGIEFEGPIKDLRNHLVHDKHVFTGAASTNILRLLPPLCLSMDEAKEAIELLK